MAGVSTYKILEEEYAQFVGTRYAVAVNTGTAGLHLSLVALGIGEGDEVIVPDFTMAACGFAVSYTGAKVVTVDCGEDYNIDVDKIEEKITPKTRAIMAVHIYGRLCNMRKIREIADRHKLFVIEDGCEAQGVAIGGYSDCLVFSFYKNKIIHAEEGGIICTNSKEIYDKLNYYKNMCFNSEHNYFHEHIGFNYRMTDSQAQMALNSLDEYPKNMIRRKREEDRLQKIIPTKSREAVWVYDFLCSSQEERDKFVKENPNARYFFKPLSTMPMWEQEVGQNALRYSQLGAYLHLDLTKNNQV